MKKITFILLSLALVFSSCEKKKKDDPRVFDPNATVLLRAAKGVKVRSTDNPEHLTALEIVKQASNITFRNEPIYGDQAVGRGFADAQRDLDTPALKMFASDIIWVDGTYVPEFIEATDCVLNRIFRDESGVETGADTIAYIPNETLRAAEIAIKAAFEAENYEEVYRLFHEAFTFTPITGKEWRALKSEGNQ